MATRGRPKGQRKMRARQAYRAVAQLADTMRSQMKDAWKDYKREAGRENQTQASAEKAIDSLIDAATLSSMLQFLSSGNFVNLTKHDTNVMKLIDAVRYRLLAEEAAYRQETE